MTAPALATATIAELLANTAQQVVRLKAVRLSIRDLRVALAIAGRTAWPTLEQAEIAARADVALAELETHLIEHGWHAHTTTDKTLCHWLADAALGEIASHLHTAGARLAHRR